MPMPPKRRYCQYSFEDTQRALEQQQRQLKVQIVPDSSSRNGRRVGIMSAELDKLIAKEEEARLGSPPAQPPVQRASAHREFHAAVILARSSDWYRFNLNTYRHNIECAIVGTHDSCLEVPALAMDGLEWYGIEKIRFEKLLAPAMNGTVDPKAPMHRETNPDLFEKKYRKSHYGHCVLVGSLIRGRKDARDRLMTLPERTRFRIEAEVRRLRERRPGRPLLLWEISEEDLAADTAEQAGLLSDQHGQLF